MSKQRYETGSRNVFKDLGMPNPEEHFVKAQLVFKIDTLMKERGGFRQFSVERLLHFLVALDQDVEIVIKPHRDTKHAPALHVS